MQLPGWSRRRWLGTLALAAPLLGLFGVVAAELVPDGRIAAHLTSAMQRGELTVEDRTISPLGTTSDHYAECTAVMLGLGDPEANVVRRALFSATSYGCDPVIGELEGFAATGVLRPQGDYMRYWHGYAVMTRPALAIFGLSGTRWLSFAVLGVVASGFARTVARRHGTTAAALLVAPALLTTDMIIGGLAVSQALGLATAWAAGWLVYSQVAADPHWQVVAVAAALGAALNAYFDLMVAIPASLALCTVAAGLAAIGDGRAPALARTMAVAAGGWTVGLAGMWASKWVFAWLFVDRHRIVESVRDQVEFRTGGDYEGVSSSRLSGFTSNLRYWWERPLTPVVVVGVLVVAGFVCSRRGVVADRRQLGRASGAALVAFVPVFAWYVVLNNHNQIHNWLTYRSLAVAFGAIATLVVVALTHEAATGGTVGSPARYALGNGDDEAITSEPSEERDPFPH